MSNKPTPIQQALNECNRLASNVAQTADGLKICRAMQTFLKNQLPTEKRFAKEMFEAGRERGQHEKTTYRDVFNQSLSEKTTPKFIDLYKQYEP